MTMGWEEEVGGPHKDRKKVVKNSHQTQGFKDKSPQRMCSTCKGHKDSCP